MFWASIKFQNFLSIINSNLESLHDMIMVWLILIVLIVSLLFVKMKSVVTSFLLTSLVLEVLWTVIPIIILIIVAIPSIYLLCIQDSNEFWPDASLKLVGSQWNWTSMYKEEVSHLLDSYKVYDMSSMAMPVFLKLGSLTRVLITSSDVLHSLGIPSMGVKLDANPGRINVSVVESTVCGLAWASCFELCGSGHGIMPLVFMSL